MYGYFNRVDLIYSLFIMVPILILAFVVSIRVKVIYSKYSKFRSLREISGAVVARNILDSYGLYNIEVEPTVGELTDHYDPIAGVVRLSHKNYYGTSIAAIGIVAHEVGHAVQHAKNYIPVKIRSAIFPITNVVSVLSMPIFVAGLFFSIPRLSYIGIFLFSIVAFFSLITLPVEFNASARAIKIIISQNILEKAEIIGVRKVLWAAAMTYVVSFVMSVAQIVKLLLIVWSRDDD